MFPILPWLISSGIIGGESPMEWYGKLDSDKQAEINRQAADAFGRTFPELTEAQQTQLIDTLSKKS